MYNEENKVTERRRIIAIIMSFMSSIAFPYILKSSNDNYSLSNSVLIIFVFIGFFMIINCALKKSDFRLKIIGLVLGTLFSMSLVLGSNIIKVDLTLINSGMTWIKIILFSPVVSSCSVLIIKMFAKITNDDFDKKEKVNKRKLFFIVWLIIFVAWIPTLCASYPGIYAYDSIFQVKWYMEGTVNTHHPIVHTYLLGFFIVNIGDILGSPENGMVAYCICQMLLMSAIFSIIYVFYIKERMRKLFRIIILLLFMFFPLNAIMAVSSTKDIMFSGFFALFIFLLLLFMEKKERIKNWKFILALIITSVLVIMFRNQGVYICITGFVLMLIFLKNYKNLNCNFKLNTNIHFQSQESGTPHLGIFQIVLRA